MAVYLLTGKLGSGKSLAAVARAIEYLDQGRRVVANFRIDVLPVCKGPESKRARAVVECLPDRPTSLDLRALGRGGPTEERAGLLILDECATWLNARTWNGTDREAVIDWFLHSRKLGWDVILICQHSSALDKQVREMICEFLVTCRRLDRFNLPILGFKLPKVHVASVRYGLSPTDLNAEHWVYRGTQYYECYNTLWESQGSGSSGWYSVLPPSHIHYRNLPPPRPLLDRLRSHPVGLWIAIGFILLSSPFYALSGLSGTGPRKRREGGTRDRSGRGGRAFIPSTWRAPVSNPLAQ